MKKNRPWLLLVLVVPAAYFCLAVGQVANRLRLNEDAGREIVQALTERYPEVTCKVSPYERPELLLRDHASHGGRLSP
jgi:hypothetical protein